MALICFLLLVAGDRLHAVAPTIYEVKTYGAKGDGMALDTAAIQAAIDAAAAGGGGEVHFSAGTYRTVTLRMKSNVTLELDSDALLQASLDPGDWSALNLKPVIDAYNVSHIGLRGKGTIDGGAMAYYDPKGEFKLGNRPERILHVTGGEDIKISGLRFQNSVRWTQVYDQCDDLTVDGGIIRNREYALGRETDGIDICGGRNVLVENCDIQTGDDALCLKPMSDTGHVPPRPTRHVTFRNCTLASTCNATKIGTGTTGEAYDVLFTDITVNKMPAIQMPKNPAKNGSCIAAISMQSNDGGLMHDFIFRNYTVNDCDTPIFMEVQNRQENFLPHSFGSIYDVLITDFTCNHSMRASQINVQLGGSLRDITLRNLVVHNLGTSGNTVSPPYLKGAYPDAQRYGEMPAFGIFARCVDGLALEGTLEFHDDGKSGRPATQFEDVAMRVTAPR